MFFIEIVQNYLDKATAKQNCLGERGAKAKLYRTKSWQVKDGERGRSQFPFRMALRRRANRYISGGPGMKGGKKGRDRPSFVTPTAKSMSRNPLARKGLSVTLLSVFQVLLN